MNNRERYPQSTLHKPAVRTMIPPVRILAAVDFSEPSRTALNFAGRLTRQSGAELHVMYAEDPLLAAAARTRGVNLAAESREELRTFAAGTRPAPDGEVRYHVMTGEPVDAVLDVAHREHADVIVLGARGISGAERLVFGSTAEGLLRRADLPVIVVPEAWTPASPATADLTGMGPVICGVDLTLPSIEAAEAGTQLASLLKTDAVLVHVVPQLSVLERWRAHAEEATRQRLELARRDLDHITKHTATIGRARLQIETGNIPECLATVAHASTHSMLVLGRALGPGGYTPPGSNAYRALTLARVPVMMHVTRD